MLDSFVVHFLLAAVHVSCEDRIIRLPITFSPSRQHDTTLACCNLVYKPSKAASKLQLHSNV